MVKEMPGGPEWQACDVMLHDAPEEPQIFYYRDIIKCAKYLFQMPEFNGHMEFSPRTARDGDGNIIYHEMNTGEDWHEVQVYKHRIGCVCRLRHFARPRLTSGQPSSLSFSHQTKHTSQTTPVTNQCIPVYISLGNIHKNLRRKRDSKAWLLLAKLPTGQFRRTHFGTTKKENARMPGILRQRLFHLCMRIVLEPLRTDNHVYRTMVGPDAKLRQCVAVLMAWIADLEEQLMIAGVVNFNCPVCLASWEDLGTLYCFSCRSEQWTL